MTREELVARSAAQRAAIVAAAEPLLRAAAGPDRIIGYVRRYPAGIAIAGVALAGHLALRDHHPVPPLAIRQIESLPFARESSDLFDRPSINLGRIQGGDAGTGAGGAVSFTGEVTRVLSALQDSRYRNTARTRRFSLSSGARPYMMTRYSPGSMKRMKRQPSTGSL